MEKAVKTCVLAFHDDGSVQKALRMLRSGSVIGAPTDTVTVTVTPDVTKTTRTGGIRHDEIQVAISSSDDRVTARACERTQRGG